MKKTTKILTIRFPVELWKKLMLLKIDGKIKSVQDLTIKTLTEVVNKK